MEIFDEVIWHNGHRRLRAFVSGKRIVNKREKIDLIFEDGRWFNALSVESLKLNSVWDVTGKNVSLSERELWTSLSESRPTYIYVVGFDVLSVEKDSEGRTKINNNAVYVEASNKEAAESTVVSWIHTQGVLGAASDIKDIQLANCQFKNVNSKVIEAH
jgi:hypothetical protein